MKLCFPVILRVKIYKIYLTKKWFAELTCYISTDLEVPSKGAAPLSQLGLSAIQVTHSSLTYLFPADVCPVLNAIFHLPVRDTKQESLLFCNFDEEVAFPAGPGENPGIGVQGSPEAATAQRGEPVYLLCGLSSPWAGPSRTHVPGRFRCRCWGHH